MLIRSARRSAIAGVAALAAGVCVYAVRQVDPDLYGYLAYGRLFVQLGALPQSDPFAYTSAGLHWVAFEYLSQLLLWTTYNHFGPIGLIGLKCFVGGSAVFFLWQAVSTATDDPIVWGPLFLLATSTVSRYFLFRPQLFTFACFALFVWVLFQFLLRGHARLWMLPIVMLLWVNTHGGFPSGLGALLLAGVLRACANLNVSGARLRAALVGTRPLALTFVACIVASVANPQGFGLWRYVLTELVHDTNRHYIAEWQPVSWGRDAWSATALTFMTLTLIGVAWIAERRRLRIAGVHAWQWALGCAPFIGMAYWSVRHVPLAAIWTAPVLAALAASIRSASPSRVFRRLWIVVGAGSLVPILLTVQYVVAHPSPVIAAGGTVLGPTNPCRAVAFIRGNKLQGNVYGPLWWGAYLTWEAYPAVRVSMDGRNVSLFPDEMVARNLRFFSREATRPDLDDPLRYDTDFLLVPSNAVILEMVRVDERWRQIYVDGEASVFLRADAAHGPLLASLETPQAAAPECAEVLAPNASSP